MAQSGYVNPAVCAECHGDIAATYHKTGMGRSFSPAAPGKVIGNFTRQNTICNKPSNLCYTMLERSGQYFERRYEIGFGGKETNVLEERIDYVMGSGNHASTFLHRNASGNLIELPVTWYSEKGGYWAMSPGYDRADQEDFRRATPQECMFCHNAYPMANEMPPQIEGEKAIFGQQLPHGIDCQRCHGPGAAHVAAARSAGSTVEKIQSTIVNPARLGRDRQLEVCMQCHLETSSRNMPNELRVFGRGVDSYRPGQPLGEYQIYLKREPPSKSGEIFEIAHQAYRLRMSACFRDSDMTCLTCHDPHKTLSEQAEGDHYQKVCLSCHENVKHTVALPRGAKCVDCHMPKRRAEDAVHVVMTDHYIQRNLPARNLLAPLPENVDTYVPGSKIALYYPQHLPPTTENKLLLATAKVSGPHESAADIANLQDMLDRDPSSHPEAWLELGRAYVRTRKSQEAIRCFDHLLQKDPTSMPAVEGIVPELLATGQTERAKALLQSAVARYPRSSLLLTNLGNALLREGNAEQAQQELRQALEVNPENADAENLLGLAFLRNGDQAQAETHFREAIRYEPRNPEAHNNLANLLAGDQRLAEAQYHYQRAIAIDPTYTDAHHGYGLLLILLHKYPEALTEMQDAVKLDPGNPTAFDDLGDLLAAQGKAAAAAESYSRAISLDPNRFDARLGLGLALLREHKVSQAITELQRATASPDPAIAGAATEALHNAEK